MNLKLFPKNIRPFLIPSTEGEMIYRCLGCSREWEIRHLLYTCPGCGSVLLLYDRYFDRIKQISPNRWR
ncbi:MAG: threonine synthase, partial [Thermodesulfobacteriota bacterium]